MQGRVSLVQGLTHVIVRVVEQGHVDPVQPQTFQALLEGTTYPICAEVPTAAVCGGHVETLVVTPVAGPGFEDPPDLGAQCELPTGQLGQGLAQAAFGQAQAVMGCGVE